MARGEDMVDISEEDFPMLTMTLAELIAPQALKAYVIATESPFAEYLTELLLKSATDPVVGKITALNQPNDADQRIALLKAELVPIMAEFNLIGRNNRHWANKFFPDNLIYQAEVLIALKDQKNKPHVLSLSADQKRQIADIIDCFQLIKSNLLFPFDKKKKLLSSLIEALAKGLPERSPRYEKLKSLTKALKEAKIYTDFGREIQCYEDPLNDIIENISHLLNGKTQLNRAKAFIVTQSKEIKDLFKELFPRINLDAHQQSYVRKTLAWLVMFPNKMMKTTPNYPKKEVTHARRRPKFNTAPSR